MKKIISILLAVMLIVSVAAVSFGAVSYIPTEPYTVNADTPYTEEAIFACGGASVPIQRLYFQAPEDWANKFNTFPGPDDDEPYAHICIYWWMGIGSEWPDGTGVKWCGYQAHLVDKENRIYEAQVPADEGTPTVVWNNGVNGGMDSSQEIFRYGRQLSDINIEGAFPGEYDTLPEGAPSSLYDEWNFDGCISIINYDESRAQMNALTGCFNYGIDWYVYYGKGCYGNYPMTSTNYKGRTASCINPEHEHLTLGDVNHDKIVDILDVVCIQRYLVELHAEGFDLQAADIDGDGYISIIDATRIQRYLAGLCNLDGSISY